MALQQRRLAGAVGAEQGDDLAFVDVEVDAEEDLQRPVGDVDAAGSVDQRAHGGRPAARRTRRSTSSAGWSSSGSTLVGAAVGDEARGQDAAGGPPGGGTGPGGCRPPGRARRARAGARPAGRAGDQQPVLGTDLLEGPQREHAEQHAADGAETADDGHREDLEALDRLVAPDPHAVEHDGVQAAGDAGEHPGEHEAGQDDAGGGDGRRLRRPAVVAGGSSTRPARERRTPAGSEDEQDQEGQAQVVHGPGPLQREALPQDGPVEALGDPVVEVGRVEEVAVDGHGEGQRGHGQEQAPDPQGRQPDEEGDGGAGEPETSRARNRSTSSSGHEVGGDHGARPHDGELAEADVPAPAGQHDQRQADHAQTSVSDRVVVVLGP